MWDAAAIASSGGAQRETAALTSPPPRPSLLAAMWPSSRSAMHSSIQQPSSGTGCVAAGQQPFGCGASGLPLAGVLRGGTLKANSKAGLVRNALCKCLMRCAPLSDSAIAA